MRRIMGLLVVLLVLAPMPADAKPHRRDDVPRYQMKVISHNIAGGAMNAGVPKARRMAVRLTTQRDTLAVTEEQIAAFRPVIVGLQEVCSSQYEALVEDYPDWSIQFTPMLAHDSRCAVTTSVNDAIGQVLMSPYPMTSVTRTDLGYNDGARDFVLTCGEVAVPGLRRGVHACNTHLRVASSDPTQAYKIGQLTTIQRTLAPIADETAKTTVVTCDCNAGPRHPGMDHVYSLTTDGPGDYTGAGDFSEADETDPTLCPNGPCRSSKHGIDDVFVSRITARGGTMSEGKIADDRSDHLLTRGWVNVRGVP